MNPPEFSSFDPALVAFLQAHAPLPPPAPPDLEERILAQFHEPSDEDLVQFLQAHAPTAPSPGAALEERIFAALDAPREVEADLVAFLQTHAPVAPPAPPQLEERILQALDYKVISLQRWVSVGAASIAAALLVVLSPQLLTALNPPTATPEVEDLALDPKQTSVFAVNPDTGLYDVRL